MREGGCRELCENLVIGLKTALTRNTKDRFIPCVDIVGPYFFEEEGVTVKVTSDHYIHLLKNFLKPQLEHLKFE